MERLLKYFVPEKYKLDLTIDKHKKTTSGVVTVFGASKAENIKFHVVGLSVDEVLVNGKNVDFKCENGVLTLKKVPRSDLRVEIGYHGSLNENMEGAYLSTYEYRGKTEVIVATQFESHYAREAFPCIDEPAAKAVFELTISVPDADDMVLSNMAALKIDSGPRPAGPSPWAAGANPRAAALRNAQSQTSNAGFKTISFEPTPRMSTYLLAWVIGRFHGKTVTNKHGVEITTYATLSQDVDSVDFANEIAARSLEFYDDNFGVPYPLKKLDQVALPDFEAGAMENWGLVTYRESMLLVGKNATLGTKKSVALTVAHELSHQWFGDLVTMEWWDDLWLNESFASIMEYYAVEKIHPEYRIFESFFTGDALAALTRDAYSDVQSVHQDVNDPAEIATLFDPAIVYSKGARLMLMLIRAMGWRDFCKGLKKYFEKYQYDNTVGDNLWEALAAYAEFDPKKIMHEFIDKPGYPVIDDNGQRRFLLDGEITKSDWLLPGVTEDMSGYYVINLTDEEFAARLASFDGLELEERLRLLMDRSLVVRTNLASAASLLPLALKFQNDNSAAVWNIILVMISQLKIFFEFDSPEEKKFKKYVGMLVAPKLKEIGIKTREGDDENTLKLRAILLGLDFYAETRADLEELKEFYNEDYEKIDAEVRSNVLDAKIYLEPKILKDYLVAYKKLSDPEIKFDLLFAMTLSRDEKNIDKMVGLLNQLTVVKPQDQFYLFIYLYRNPLARKKVFDWLTHNWDFVKKMSGDKSLENYPRYLANSVRTEAEFEKYMEFFGPMKKDPALKRAIVIGEKEIGARLKLIESDKKAVFKCLGDII